jgi:uncharacterized protein YacL
MSLVDLLNNCRANRYDTEQGARSVMRDVHRVDGALIRAADAMATLLVAQEHNNKTRNIYHFPVAI